MAQVNSYEGRCGFLSIAVTALADNGTAVINLPKTCNGRFLVGVHDDSGNEVPLAPPGSVDLGVSVNYSSSAKTLTFKNETGGALTGICKAMILN